MDSNPLMIIDKHRYNKTMKNTHRECQNNRLENEMDIQIIEFKMPDHPCRAGIAIVYINSLPITIKVVCLSLVHG